MAVDIRQADIARSNAKAGEAPIRPGVERLGALAVFAALAPDVLAELNEASDFARLGPGEDVLVEGEIPGELCFLVTGAAVAIQRGAVADVFVPPDVVASPAALLGLACRATVRTILSSHLILVPVAALRRLLATDAELARGFLAQTLRGFHRLQGECFELKLLSSARRLGRYLLTATQQADMVPIRFVLPFEKRYLAGKIGCSQENLSRAFATLRGFGVETQNGVVVIHHPDRLRAFADPESSS